MSYLNRIVGMKRNTLILLCNNYPLSFDKFFDERAFYTMRNFSIKDINLN